MAEAFVLYDTCGPITSNTTDFEAMLQHLTQHAEQAFASWCDWELIYMSIQCHEDATHMQDAGQSITNLESNDA